MKLRLTLLLVLAQIGLFTAAQAQQKRSEHWVGTWGTAENLYAAPRPAVVAAAPATPQRGPIGPRGFANQTARMMVRASIGGHRLRVKLANAFGSVPVVIGTAHIALRSKDSAIVAGS